MTVQTICQLYVRYGDYNLTLKRLKLINFDEHYARRLIERLDQQEGE